MIDNHCLLSLQMRTRQTKSPLVPLKNQDFSLSAQEAMGHIFLQDNIDDTSRHQKSPEESQQLQEI